MKNIENKNRTAGRYKSKHMCKYKYKYKYNTLSRRSAARIS